MSDQYKMMVTYKTYSLFSLVIQHQGQIIAKGRIRKRTSNEIAQQCRALVEEFKACSAQLLRGSIVRGLSSHVIGSN